MFVDLEQGAVAVVKSVGQETSQTVGHKYGEDAGHVTKDSMAAASDAAILAGVSVCVCVCVPKTGKKGHLRPKTSRVILGLFLQEPIVIIIMGYMQ